jgi:hypothetical protein
MKVQFSRQISEKYADVKFSEKSVRRELSCFVRRHDGADSRFFLTRLKTVGKPPVPASSCKIMAAECAGPLDGDLLHDGNSSSLLAVLFSFTKR